MKKVLLTVINFIWIILFAFFLASCVNDANTLDSIENEYGVSIEGGSFLEGSLLISNELAKSSEEAKMALEKISDQNYNEESNIYIFDIYVTKDGNKVQPKEKVKVTLPIPNMNVDSYLVFHIKSDNTVEKLIPVIENEKLIIEINSFSYFVIVEDVHKEHIHNYELIEGESSTCLKEGTIKHYHCEECGKNFDMNYGEINDLTIEKSDHQYGSMYYANNPTFWNDGNIEYYYCEVCDKYFNANYKEVESVIIPKLSTNLSMCINGVATPLILVENTENQITWTLNNLNVTKGDIITICDSNNKDVIYDYFAEGNVSNEGAILTTAQNVSVNVTATPNGIMLFIDGYKYEGIVIEINGTQYPMASVTYPDGTPTYIYGYVYLEQGDEFVIVDNVNNLIYDYDDLDESDKWNIWDFHRGEDGKFVMDYSARYGIEFYDSNNKTILIDKVFAPVDGKSYGIVFEDDSMESVPLNEVYISENDEAYSELLWFINNKEVTNNQDIINYISEHGLYLYTETVYLEAGCKFNIKNNTSNYIINSDKLIDVYTYQNTFTKNEEFIEILIDGYYMITYMPCFDGFMFSDSYIEETADLFMYLDGEFIPLEVNDNNIATYEGLIANTSTMISFVSNNYLEYYPIVLDSNTNSSIATVTETSGMSLVLFNKEGTYNLSYNVETGVLTIIDQNPDGPQETVEYIYFLSVVDYTNGNQTLYFSRTPDENNEVAIKDASLFENCYIAACGVTADGSATSENYGALSGTDSSIAESYGSLVLVKKTGKFEIYFNVNEKTLRLVLDEQPNHEECTFDEGVVTKEPTHLEEGVKTFTCTVCGNKKTEPIEKTLGHSFSDWKIDKENDEKHYRECLCGEIETSDCIFGEGEVTKEATHYEEGIITYTCNECGRVKEEKINKTNDHVFTKWQPCLEDEDKHYHECDCGKKEIENCLFDGGVVNDDTQAIKYTCILCGRIKELEIEQEEGIVIVISCGTATFEGKETVTSDSKIYGENANVYIAQLNDVVHVSLNSQDGRVFKHWVSATGTVIPDEEFSILVFRSGYYYPVFEDINDYTNRKMIYQGDCEEGTLYMSTNSKGDIKYEIEFETGGHHDFCDVSPFNSQFHKQECSACGKTIYEEHSEYDLEIIKEAGHAEEGQIKYICHCGYEWYESIPVTEDHTVDYDNWDIVEESKNGEYGKYRVHCKYCDYYEEYWYLGNLDFVGFMENKMINYQYTYGGKVCHNEYYYSYKNSEGQKVYIWAIQYESERSSNQDYNDTYIFMYIDDEDSKTLEPIYLSKSRGDRRSEYLWAIYSYAYDVNDWIETLDSPDFNVGCGNGMILSNSMSARSSVFESYHDYWAETYNKLRIPTTKEYNDLSDTVWEIDYEGKSFQGGYLDENGEYVTTGGRDVIWYVKDKETSYKKYMYVDKETGITYGYEDLGTYYRTTFIMRSCKEIVSPEEFTQLDDASKSVVYSYGDIEKDIKSLCANRTAFNNFTLTVPETINSFRFLFSDPYGCVDVSGNNTNVYYNSAYVYDSGSPITLTWNGEEGIVFDCYEIWDFENQKWIELSNEANYTFNSLENPRRTAAYVRVSCHEEDIPVEPDETYRISIENGYFEIDGKYYYDQIEVASGTTVYLYANEALGKTFDHWVDGNNEEINDHCVTVTSNMSFSPVYVDSIYTIYCEGWNYNSYVSVNGGEPAHMNEVEGKLGEKVELTTTPDDETNCNIFIGWYIETYGPNGHEYVFLSESTTFTYEIKGNESGSIYAGWTEGDNPFIKKYVDIRVENGFVMYSGGEVGGLLDNAYSAISVSNMGRIELYDDPTDEVAYTFWDMTYRYELEGELVHDIRESHEDEYDYYPADFWIDDPQYSYPEGIINVTGILNPYETPEEGEIPQGVVE